MRTGCGEGRRSHKNWRSRNKKNTARKSKRTLRAFCAGIAANRFCHALRCSSGFMSHTAALCPMRGQSTIPMSPCPIIMPEYAAPAAPTSIKAMRSVERSILFIATLLYCFTEFFSSSTPHGSKQKSTSKSSTGYYSFCLLSNIALSATITVLTDINTAASHGWRIIPLDASAPAASGIATTL